MFFLFQTTSMMRHFAARNQQRRQQPYSKLHEK